MAYEFKFPDVGEGIVEGSLVKWHVKVGDKVKIDDILAEVETDKAVVEIPTPVTGKVLKLHFKEKETMKVGQAMVTLDSKTPPPKAHPKDAQHEDKSTSVVGTLEIATDKDILPLPKEAMEKETSETKINSTPAVRALAKKLNVDLNNVKATGEGNRITKDDVEKAASSGAKLEQSQAKAKHVRKYDFYGYIEHVPLQGLRKIIAANMVESKFTKPHVVHMDEADVNKLYELRKSEMKNAKKKKIKLTFLPFMVIAAVRALKKHPYLNSFLENDDIILKKYYNIGIAVDTPEGLMVPVVKAADSKSIFDIAKDIGELAKKAKTRKIDLSDLKGGTFTITNIGSIGGIFVTPVINPDESAILALGKIQDKVVLDSNKNVSSIKVQTFSISYDHRVVDGAEVARFANTFKGYLEDPESLLKE